MPYILTIYNLSYILIKINKYIYIIYMYMVFTTEGLFYIYIFVLNVPNCSH